MTAHELGHVKNLLRQLDKAYAHRNWQDLEGAGAKRNERGEWEYRVQENQDAGENAPGVVIWTSRGKP